MQYGIFPVHLGTALGSEMDKSRTCIVVSPDELNKYLPTVVVVPLTTTVRDWPYRPLIHYRGLKCDACVDQIRVVDKSRLGKRSMTLAPSEIAALKQAIQETYVD